MRRRVIDTYQYHDEHGRLVYQLVRYEPKRFAFFKPNGRPWTAKRRRRLLYRLPELLVANRSKRVYVVEGEKDVDRLWQVGLVATCNDNGGGHGKWSREHSRHLKGRSVVIIPDNDATGREHAGDVARRLQGVAAKVRLLDLPGLPHKGDITDWLDAGNTAAKLARLTTRTPIWTQAPEPPPTQIHDYHAFCDAAYARGQIYVADLTAVEKLLLIILVDTRGRTTPTQNALASYLGVTERHVRQLVASLRGRGILTTRPSKRSVIYSIHRSRF